MLLKKNICNFRTLKLKRSYYVSIPATSLWSSIMSADLQHPSHHHSKGYTYHPSLSCPVTTFQHDEFLNFRGEGTRHNITVQLHQALEEARIPTFKDDMNLEKGGEIASELLKAIQMSRIASHYCLLKKLSKGLYIWILQGGSRTTPGLPLNVRDELGFQTNTCLNNIYLAPHFW